MSESISLLMGGGGAIAMGWDISSVLFVGDSQTALTWAREGRFRSSNVRNSAVAMTMIGPPRISTFEGHTTFLKRIIRRVTSYPGECKGRHGAPLSVG